MKKIQAACERNTKETSVRVSVDFSAADALDISTGLPFFDHLLTAMAHHGGFSLSVRTAGDLEVDAHHCVEDTGLVLGEALGECLRAAGAVERFAHERIPMDDALCEVAVDVCGRPYLVYRADYPQPQCGGFDICLVREFLLALASRARINLHARCLYGENTHHMAEALFKALGRALGRAYRPRSGGVEAMSTKGSL